QAEPGDRSDGPSGPRAVRPARQRRLGLDRRRLAHRRRGLDRRLCQAPRPPEGTRLMAVAKQTVEHVAELERYKHGFVTDIDQEMAPKGLSEDTIRFISAKKSEPEWMLALRLEAFERWLALEEPTWAKVHFPRIDYQDAYYYA